MEVSWCRSGKIWEGVAVTNYHCCIYHSTVGRIIPEKPLFVKVFRQGKVTADPSFAQSYGGQVVRGFARFILAVVTLSFADYCTAEGKQYKCSGFGDFDDVYVHPDRVVIVIVNKINSKGGAAFPQAGDTCDFAGFIKP